MDNIVEVKSKSYVCQNCKTGNQSCKNCGSILKEDNFYYWLILNRLLDNHKVTISFANNLGNKGTKIVELFKNSVGLQETGRNSIKEDCIKLELQCKCGNMMTLFTQSDQKQTDYTCMKCKTKSFILLSKSKTKLEKTEIVLEKISAVRAMSER